MSQSKIASQEGLKEPSATKKDGPAPFADGIKQVDITYSDAIQKCESKRLGS